MRRTREIRGDEARPDAVDEPKRRRRELREIELLEAHLRMARPRRREEIEVGVHADDVRASTMEAGSDLARAVQLGGGWTELALPSEEEAQRYFASFRRAPPDNSALAPGTQVRS